MCRRGRSSWGCRRAWSARLATRTCSSSGPSSGRGRVEAVAGFGPDDLLAAGADADEDDRHTDEVGDEVEVVARGLGQVGERAALGDVLAPAGQRDVLAHRVVQDRLVVREGVERRPLVAAVARADAEDVEAAENVELRDDEAGERVQARGVAQRDEVEPAGAAR